MLDDRVDLTRQRVDILQKAGSVDQDFCFILGGPPVSQVCDSHHPLPFFIIPLSGDHLVVQFDVLVRTICSCTTFEVVI